VSSRSRWKFISIFWGTTREIDFTSKKVEGRDDVFLSSLSSSLSSPDHNQSYYYFIQKYLWSREDREDDFENISKVKKKKSLKFFFDTQEKVEAHILPVYPPYHFLMSSNFFLIFPTTFFKFSKKLKSISIYSRRT